MRILFCVAALCWIMPSASAQAAKCAPVEGEYILASEFAAVVPAFAALAPDTALAPSPKPSVRRMFRSFEIEWLARKHGITAESAADVCFEHPMETLDRERVLEAIQEALANPDAHIEIIEVSQFPVPRGKLVFRKEALAVPASPGSRIPVFWHGDVVVGDGYRFSVWARVVMTTPLRYLVAANAIKRGEPITADRIREESGDRFPVGSPAPSAQQIVGMIAIRDIAAGAEIRLNQLTARPEVGRGELVEVEVVSGGARLSLTGKAESSGRTGDTVNIRNLTSNRIFQARVIGKGKALLDSERLQRN